MDEIKDIIPLLQYLLPGFLAAWIFYGLTSFEKPSPFERIIQALILTLIVQSLVIITRDVLELADNPYISFGEWSSDSSLVWSVIHGAVTGLLFSFLANKNGAHEILEKLGITKETSFPSQWVSAFSQNAKYIILHLEGGRRIFGWPREWPCSPVDGHIFLTGACWLTEDEVIPLEGMEGILIPSSQVEYVEFVNHLVEQKQ